MNVLKMNLDGKKIILASHLRDEHVKPEIPSRVRDIFRAANGSDV